MSLVLAFDYRVRDFGVWWSMIFREIQAMAELNAHHVVVYRSIDDPNRVFVTIGVHEQEPLRALLRSPKVFEWFDAAGVEDLPPIFAGEVVEKVDLQDCEATGVIVASITTVASVERMQAAVHVELARMRRAGVIRHWLYRSFDDETEVMILREVETERQAELWLRYPEVGAKFMAEAGGLYPPPFVGRLVRTIEIAEV